MAVTNIKLRAIGALTIKFRRTSRSEGSRASEGGLGPEVHTVLEKKRRGPERAAAIEGPSAGGRGLLCHTEGDQVPIARWLSAVGRSVAWATSVVLLCAQARP